MSNISIHFSRSCNSCLLVPEWNFFPLVIDIKVDAYFCLGKNKQHCLLSWRLGHVPRVSVMKMQTQYRETARLDFSGSELFFGEVKMLWKLARHSVAFWGERCKSSVAPIHAQMLRKIGPDVLLLPNVSVTKIAVFQMRCFFLHLLQNLTGHGLPHCTLGLISGS